VSSDNATGTLASSTSALGELTLIRLPLRVAKTVTKIRLMLLANGSSLATGENCGGVYGGSGIGGIQGFPARASWMAVRTWAPCLATVEM
jgi:hypothetical protein